MHTTISLLDAYKKAKNIPSDNQLAKHWNVTRQRIGAWRTGDHTFSDDKAIEVAAELGYDRISVLLSIQAERAARVKNTALFSTLADAVKRLGGVAATVCFLMLALPSHEANAASNNMQLANSDCILCKIIDGIGIGKLRKRPLISTKM